MLSNDNIAKITFTKLAHSSHHTKYTPAIKTIYVVMSLLVKEKTNPETDNRLPDLFIILINIWLQLFAATVFSIISLASQARP